jgi:hypothetical protein
MKKLLVVILFALATPFAAQALPSNQVLVLTTATQVDTAGFGIRRGVVVQNNGPNAIYCRVGSSTGLAVGYGHRIAPGDFLALPITQFVPVYCLAATANQVAGAATDVTEL